MTPLDLYRIMQVHPYSDQDMIDFAYKKLCKKYHPDVQKVPIKMIQDINYAYEILSDVHKRAEYDREYCRRTFRTNSYEREQIDQSQKVIESYFKYVTTGNYAKAYDLISLIDRQRIRYDVFSMWQSMISSFYKIHDYQIYFVENHYNMSVEDKKIGHVVEYHVCVHEKDLTSTKEHVDNMNKLVLKEQGLWRVFLGYKKLEAHTTKLKLFKELPVQNTGQNNETDHETFLRAIEKESYRNQRYNRDYVLLMFEIKNIDSLYAKIEENVTNYLNVVFEDLKKIYRFVDEFTRYEEHNFFVLLPETTVSKSRAVVAKTRAYLKSQKPFPLYVHAVALGNLHFSTQQMMDLAIGEMAVKIKEKRFGKHT